MFSNYKYKYSLSTIPKAKELSKVKMISKIILSGKYKIFFV